MCFETWSFYLAIAKRLGVFTAEVFNGNILSPHTPLKSSTAITGVWISPRQRWAGSQHKPPGANITPDKLATRLEKGEASLLCAVHFLSFPHEQEVIGLGEKLSLKARQPRAALGYLTTVTRLNWHGLMSPC